MSILDLSFVGAETAPPCSTAHAQVLLPNCAPDAGMLPNGSVVVYPRAQHRRSAVFLAGQLGAGMLLARFDGPPRRDLPYLAHAMSSGVRTGDRSTFFTFYRAAQSRTEEVAADDLLVLINAGRREQSWEAFEQGLSGVEYYRHYRRAIKQGMKTRRRYLQRIGELAGVGLSPICHLNHASMEKTGRWILYRKGAYVLRPGSLGVLPGSAAQPAHLVRPRPRLRELFWTAPHGTGRRIPREHAEEAALDCGFRQKVFVPGILSDDLISQNHPDCFRPLQPLLERMEPYLEVVATLEPVAAVILY